jgi:serine protease Do
MQRFFRTTAVLAAALALAATAAPAAARSVPDFTRIVEDNRDAVVNIATTQKVESGGMPEGMLEQLPEEHPFREFFRRFGEPQQRERSSLGSGFIISADGYVLTNAHVVSEADEIVVKLNDNREFDAEVVGLDKPSDVGLLKIDASGLPTVEIGDSDDLQVGQWVLAIGSPFGLDYTATQGIVSALERNLPNDTYTPFIQTDVAVNPGNSGGPLFNGDGEVVGVNSQIFSRTGGYMGLSFAVPINVAMDIVRQLKETGEVQRGYLGVTIQPVDSGLAESFGLDKPVGALVSDVMPDSPAAAAELKAGDVILRFNGQEVTTAADLPPLVGRTEVGSTAEVEIIRDGERRTIEVEVGALSEYRDSEGGGESGGDTSDSSLNVAVRELSADERSELGLGDRGLLVQKVGPGPVAEAGIRPGDILLRIGRQPLSEVGQLKAAVEELPRGRPVAVQIRRGDNTLFVSLTLPD